MSNFIVAIDDLKARYPGCVILLVHHSGHADKHRARGAMALKGALDFEFRLEKDDATLTLANTKMKDAEPPADMFLVLETVEVGPGITSAALAVCEAPARKSRETPAQKLALTTYEAAALKAGVWDGSAFRGVHVEDWRTAFYAKHTGDSTDAKKKAFQRARRDMVNGGILSVTNDVYLVKDAGALAAITMAPSLQSSGSGTSGTGRDKVENVPVQKSEEPGQPGHTPKGCPVSRPIWGVNDKDEGDKPNVPVDADVCDPASWV